VCTSCPSIAIVASPVGSIAAAAEDGTNNPDLVDVEACRCTRVHQQPLLIRVLPHQKHERHKLQCQLQIHEPPQARAGSRLRFVAVDREVVRR
jgi:hypothetical protein